MSHQHCSCGCSGFIHLEQALALPQSQVKDLHNRYLNASLVTLLSLINFDRQFVTANGVLVYDDQGNQYLDFLGAYGALNLGHNHPDLLAVLHKVQSRPNLLQASLNALAAALAHNLAALAPGNLQRSFFCNSGAEAVEGALKLARIATGRQKFIYCSNSFHGKTLGALSVTGRHKYRHPFKPLLNQCVEVPYGDLSALQQQLADREAAAFIVEPIQGEGGIIEPPAGYLAKAKKLCARYGTLLIADEVQTGFGRTGTFFACEAYELVPDIICIAKSLGGGIMPIGAYITSDELWRQAYGTMDKALLHTSTFGGNTLACAVALKTIEIIMEQDLCRQARENGSYLLAQLNKLKEKYPMLKDVRGRGLMIGLEFRQPAGHKTFSFKFTLNVVQKLAQEYLGSLVAGELLNKHRIITAYTLNNPNVIRLQPPLMVTREQIDRVLNALEEILTKHTGFFSMVGAGAKNLLIKL
ncbi:aspartate aminotransferase family protein [Desulforamulus hydrothermalis]|uniref:Putrescine aminotransferase n=1 Tax=Desulforamulus hydrothermalis Lam5 = DSM 18033 TaxID=1121428 RepID=K8EA63_9FIRM|nr:aspartate aminotransferase family protein [Desulforamulus hydrothermalis]CCO08483.1 Putrescine aminotransferase [Desulforamulus hydrothermalis Lam5 = DSM 18033]SHH29340.1 putrescine aminotransferase [Desulforamulus hydrothermalis Lam5 = DSM 18033]